MEEFYSYLQNVVTLVTQYRWLGIMLVVGAAGFASYRLVDLLQVRFVRNFDQPKDLKLSPEVYNQKRERKADRSKELFWKGIASWFSQVIFVAVVPLLIILMHGWGVSYGIVYFILIVLSFLLNMLISKLFPVYNPSRPFICRDFQHERTWRPGNVAFHAWGVVSWAVPAYFLWEAYGENGWVGSVVFIVISQILQLFIFIFSIKKAAIPYQQYPGLSDNFKKNLHVYLQSQSIRDDEVGVIEGTQMGPNAFATGLFGYKQIVLTDELIQGYPDPHNTQFVMKLSDNTLEAITAHEVGHLRYHHVEKGMILGIIITSLMTIAVYHLFSGSPTAYLVFAENTDQQLLLYWGQSIFNILLVYPLTFFMLYISRGKEWQADTHLLETNGCKEGYDFFYQIRHLAPVPNLPAWHNCNGTHPAPEDREERMRKWADEHCKNSNTKK